MSDIQQQIADGAQPLARVSDVIEHGQDIPANVRGMRDHDGDLWVRDEDEPGTWRGAWPEAIRAGSHRRYNLADGSLNPFTVVEVDPEPQPAEESGLTVPCDGRCGEGAPHDAHLAPGALERLDPSGAHLGLATTRQLLEELKARRITAPSRGEGQRLEDTAIGLLRALTPAALDYRTAEPAESGPVVLSLPQVPDGAVALIGGNGHRWLPKDGMWWNGAGGANWRLVDLLASHGPLTVEFAPPRKPRTWAPIETEDEDPDVVDVYREEMAFTPERWHRMSGSAFYEREGCADRTLGGLRELGKVTEVLDDGQ